MRSILLSSAAILLSCTAHANQSDVIAGDQNFLADAYEDAATGRDFSYARAWGERRAYDGTNTARAMNAPTPKPAATNNQSRPQGVVGDHLVLKSSRRLSPTMAKRPKLRGRLTQ